MAKRDDFPVWVWRVISSSLFVALLGLILYNAQSALNTLEKQADINLQLRDRMTQSEMRLGGIEERLRRSEAKLDALRP